MLRHGFVMTSFKCLRPVSPPRSPELAVPCGQCMACRIQSRRVWTHRLILEAALHPYSSFLTLTYSDEHLPSEFSCPDTGQVYAPYSVNPAHHVQFMDALRTRYRRLTGNKIRFYGVGEYGDRSQRPHYHYALFGFPSCQRPRLADYRRSKFEPCVCSNCKLVSEVWGKGHIFLGSLTPDSAGYVCGYVTKKLTSDTSTFQQDILKGRHPEFFRSSRRPGIAFHAAQHIADAFSMYDYDEDNLPKVVTSPDGKQRPLGRYLNSKIELAMYGDPTDEARSRSRRLYEESLSDLCASSPIDGSLSRKASDMGASPSLVIQFLNQQRALNLEARSKMSKEKVL